MNKTTALNRPIHYQQRAPFWVARFNAMACPCELLIATENLQNAQHIATVVAQEVWRIEAKYSRYTAQGITATINNAQGKPTLLDEETLGLFHYAQQLYTLSEGLFDISSGVLKKLWDFRNLPHTNEPKNPSHSKTLPKPNAIAALLPFIGLQKAHIHHNQLTLPKGMQLDFGGIGKEYAADKALQLVLHKNANLPLLINLGGDIVASQSLAKHPWRIGICDYAVDKNNSPQNDQTQKHSTQNHLTQNHLTQNHQTQTGQTQTAAHNMLAPQKSVTLHSGAITTSGINERQWIINGKSYSHLLNPKTGWPIESPPIAVTVAAPTCMQAGMLSTLIMLQGQKAEAFAQQEAIQCWITR